MQQWRGENATGTRRGCGKGAAGAWWGAGRGGTRLGICSLAPLHLAPAHRTIASRSSARGAESDVGRVSRGVGRAQDRGRRT